MNYDANIASLFLTFERYCLYSSAEMKSSIVGFDKNS